MSAVDTYVVAPAQDPNGALTWIVTISAGVDTSAELLKVLGSGVPYWILSLETIQAEFNAAEGLFDAVEWDYTGAPVTGGSALASVRISDAEPDINLEKAKQIQYQRITDLIEPWIAFLTVVQSDAITQGDMVKAQKCLADQNALVAPRNAVDSCTTVQQVMDCYTAAEAEVERIKQEYAAESRIFRVKA